MEPFFGAILGLLLGHGASVFYDRFFTYEEIRGPGFQCSSCRAPFRPMFAVPFLGWLANTGRCPDCGKRLPLHWLILPAGSAAMFVASWFVFEDVAGMLLGGFFGTVFLTLTLTDFDRRLLPNRIVYPSIILAMALSWAWPNSDIVEIMAGGLTAIALAAFLFIASLPFGQGAFGMGDVKMIVLIGYVVGLPSILIALFIGTLAAGAVAFLLLVTRIRSRKDYIPHGPFLALGGLIAMWFGDDIWDAYRS